VKLLIPWHFFFTAIRKQVEDERWEWLTYFAFDDRGVLLLPDAPISLEDVLRAAFAPEPEREDREFEVLAELTERKCATLIH
jgi:hypothetical protein